MLQKNSRKSQAWSIDFVIAIAVFFGALIAFYSLLNPTSKVNKPNVLQNDASLISHQVESSKSSLEILDGNIVNETKVEQIIGNYEVIKKEMGIENDFCIHFENEKGEIISIKEGVTGVGSPEILVGGVQCR